MTENECFKIIDYKDLKEKSSPTIIKRLEKCFEGYKFIQDKKWNIFIVSFTAGGKEGKGNAKILGITDDYKGIEILKNIDSDDLGLVNAIEININNNYYLLSCFKNFKIWYYDSNSKEIKSEIIIPKKDDKNVFDKNCEYQNFKTYKPLNFIEKRKLLIVQVTYPEQYIFFYYINDDNNAFNIILLTQIKINKENDPHFSDNYFNSYLIKDKYLLIGTKIKKKEENNKNKSKNKANKNNNKNKKNNNYINNISIINKNNNSKNNNNKKNKANKNNKKDNNNKNIIQIYKENNNNNNIINDTKFKEAGMYLINLDRIVNGLSESDKAIQRYFITFSEKLICISQLRENMFICTVKLVPSNKFDYAFITFKIIEKNKEPVIESICYKYDICKNIVSSKPINDSFIICSGNADTLIDKFL